MSKEIDERVVSMQFDNALFEKNIQKSLKSVDDLNKSLNNLDGAKGFEELNKATKQVNFSPIIDSAKEVEKSFSKMEIVGTGALLRIGSELTEFGIKIGKNFWNATIGQIKSGGWKRASDIKAGKFMLEGLGLTEDQVQQMSKAASAAVTDTAAGLGEAMKAAGVLATSGLKDAQKMEDTLRGIAGMSAMTGRSFENIANIYSTVASNGKLMTMQLRQFSFAGINVAAELAKQMGTTEAAINDMVTKGQIDFQTFSDAMTEAFGDHAKDANKTFSGALANMKAALSRIGENFATPFMDNVKDVFNNLRIFFNAVNKALTPVYTDFQILMKIGNNFIEKIFNPIVKKDEKGNLESYSSSIDNIVAGLRNIYTSVIMIFKTVAEAFGEVFPPLEDSTEDFKDLTNAIRPTTDGLKLLKSVLVPIFKVIKVFTDILGKLITGASYMIRVIFSIIHAVTGLGNGLFESLDGVKEWIKQSNIFEKVLDGIAIAIFAIGAAATAIIVNLGKLFKKIIEFFKVDQLGFKNVGINIINGICIGLQTGFETLKKVWNWIVDFLPNTIASKLKIKSPSRVMMSIGGNVISGLVKGMDNNEPKLRKEVNNIGDTFSNIVNFGGSIAETFGKVAWGAIDGLITLFKKLTGKIDESNLKKTAATLVETKDVMNDIYMSNNDTLDYTVNEVQKVGDEWTNTNKSVEKSSMSLKDKLSEAYGNISNKITELGINIDAFKLVIAGFGVALVATFSKVALGMDLLGGFGKTIAKISVIAGAFLLLKNVDFTPMIDGIKSMFDSIKMVAENFHIMENLKNFMTMIRNVIEENNMILLASKALAFSFAIVLIRSLHNLSMFVLNISNTFKTLGSAVKTLTTFKYGLYETTADKILKFAIAISAIVTSLTLLGKAFATDPSGMNKAVIVIGSLIALMAIFTVLTAKIAKTKGQAIIASSAMKQIQSASWAILALVSSFIFLAAMMKDITSIAQIGLTLSTFGLVLLGFAGFLKIVDKIDIKVSLPVILSLGILILAVGHLLKTFSETFKDVNGLANTAGAIAKMVVPMLTALGGIALILHTLRNIEEKTSKSQVADGMFGLIKKIAGTDEQREFKSGIATDAAKDLMAIATVMAVMGGIIKIFSTIPVDSIPSIGYACMSLIGTFGAISMIASEYESSIDNMSGFARDLAIGVLAFAAAVKIIGNIREEDYITARERIGSIAINVIGMIAIFGLLFKKMYAGLEEVNTQIKGLGGLLATLAFGLGLLGGVFSLMPADRLEEFKSWSLIIVGILGGIIAFLNVMNLIISLFGKEEVSKVTNGFANLASVLISMGVLIGGLVVLSLIDPESLLMPLTTVGLLLLELSLLISQLGKIQNIESAKSVFISLAVIIGMISVVMVALAIIPIEGGKLAAIGASIMLIMLSLAGIIAVLNDFKVNPGTLMTLGIMTAIIVAIGIVLSALSMLGSDNALKAAGSVAIILGVVTAFTALCGVIGTFLPGASAILLSFGKAIQYIGIGIGIAAVGISIALTAMAGAFTVLAFGLDALQKIDFDYVATGLLKTAGGIIVFGGAMAGAIVLVGTALSVLVGQISKLMLSLLPALVVIGGLLMIGMQKGIKREIKNTLTEMHKADEAVVDQVEGDFGIKSPSKVFRGIGDFLMKGLALGIIDSLPFVGETLHNAIQGIIDWLNGKAKELEETGDTWGNALKLGLGDITGGLTDGLSLELPDLETEFGDLLPKADEASESMGDLGISMDDAAVSTDNMTESLSTAIDMFSEFNDQAYMTSKDVLPAFMSQIEGVAKWRDELASLSVRGLGEVIVQELEQMGPQAYEKVHALYTMTNSELAMMNIMYKQKLALQNGSIKKIDKSFKKLGDTVNETMEESMDEMNDNMVNSMDSMAGNMMKALKKQMDYEKVINQVTGFRDNIADKIRNSMSIFEAVNEQEEIKAEELLKNMKDQVKHVGKWASMITEMAAKGFDEGLVATLTDMGPQSYSKVAAFLTMSEEQIAEANRLYEASEQVPEYGADKIVKALAQAGFTASMGLTDSFLEGLDPEAVEQAMSDLGQRSITSLQDEIANKPYEIGELIPSDFADGLVAAAEAETERVQEAMQNLADAANPENYLPEVGNEDLNADMIKAFGTKEIEEARKANEANREKNLDAWRKRDSEALDVMYHQEMKKSYTSTPSKNRNFKYKVSNATESDKKLLQMLKDYYGYNKVYDYFKYNGGPDAFEIDIGKIVKEGVLQSSDASPEMVQYLRDIIDRAQGQIQDDTYAPGYMLVDNTARAIDSNESLKRGEEAGTALANAAINGVAGGGNSASISSNSVQAMDKTPLAMAAKNVALGATLAFADSIESDESMDATNTAAQNLAGSFIISLRDNLASLMDAILNSDDTTAPKIKPVFDGSNVIDGIKSLFNKNIDLSTSANIDVSTKNRDKSVVDAINAMSNNKDVVNAVNDLKDMFSMRVNDLMNMSVVMDTGALVGQLSGPIDYNLGSRSMYAGRGVL